MVDINEYERIVSESHARLFKYCYYRLGKNAELTEETLNDIFHVLYKKWHTLDFDGNLMGWLYHVADLEVKQHLRKYNAYYFHNESLDTAITEHKIDELAYIDEYFSPDDINEEEYFEEITKSLPEEYKTIFRYRFIEKHTIIETSAYVGIPYSSLRLRIDKIEKIVRQKVKALFEN